MLRRPADIYRTGGNAMDKEKFKGIFPALLTPFDSDGNVNTHSIEKLMGYCMEHGVRGFYICGSSAEVFLLEKEEREEIYRKCAKFGAGKTTLISHVGDMSVKRAVEYAKLCESLGYDAVSAVTPFYFKYTDRQIIDYYKTLADSVDIPVLLYHIPARSGVTLNESAFDELLSDDRFLGVKFTSNDYFAFERLRSKFPDKIFYNGYDEMLLCGLAMGADGAIGTTYNFMPQRAAAIYEKAKENDFSGALEYQRRLNDVIDFSIKSGSVVAAMKHAVSSKLGTAMGTCRAPGGDIDGEWKKAFDLRFTDESQP